MIHEHVSKLSVLKRYGSVFLFLRRVFRCTHGFLWGIFFVSLVSFAHAASDTFTIGATISDDVTAPSTPADLVAVPASTSQIDLTWSSSTDDTAVTGYQVFRDSVQVATTTSANYSDTGLSESTLYTYFVRAFDAIFNTSSSSASVSTTTLAAPPTPTSTPSTGGSSGSYPPPRLVSLEVIPGQTEAFIFWRTADSARTTLRYGKTISYELGTSIGQFFRIAHQTHITGLEPGTRYQFMIEGESGVGVYAVLTRSNFTTLSPVDVYPPANVKNLKAQKSGDNDIVLTWDNPVDPDFEKVRALGSDKFYPNDTQDGAFVYEGDGSSALERGTAIPNTVRFFTVFSYDTQGNVSSGAIVAIRIDADGNLTLYDPNDIPLAPDEYLLPLSLEDLLFEQDGKTLPYKNGEVHVDGSKLLHILLPYDLLPEHLKSIVMTFQDEEGKKFSFLLRVNDDRTFYTAAVAPLGTSGVFSFTTSIFDFSVQKVAELHGALISEIVQLPEDGFTSLLFTYGYLPYFVLLLMLLIWMGIVLIRRGRASTASA